MYPAMGTAVQANVPFGSGTWIVLAWEPERVEPRVMFHHVPVGSPDSAKVTR